MRTSTSKLNQLLKLMGYKKLTDIPESVIMDSVVDGICTNANCDFVADVEPDQSRGFCEDCQENTVKSLLILAGLI